MDWWGPVVYETYGGTEVGTATLATPKDWLDHPGCVGVGLTSAWRGKDPLLLKRLHITSLRAGRTCD